MKAGDSIEVVEGPLRGKRGTLMITGNVIVVVVIDHRQVPLPASYIRKPVGSGLNIPMPKRK